MGGRSLSWRVSITMEAAFCVATLEDALAKHSKPGIFNTDQRSQFTGAASFLLSDFRPSIPPTCLNLVGSRSDKRLHPKPLVVSKLLTFISFLLLKWHCKASESGQISRVR